MKRLLILISAILYLLTAVSGFAQNSDNNIITEYKVLSNGWITNFAVSVTNPDVIYAMQHSKTGYFALNSGDGGENWKKLREPGYSKEMVIDPVNPMIAFMVPGG